MNRRDVSASARMHRHPFGRQAISPARPSRAWMAAGPLAAGRAGVLALAGLLAACPKTAPEAPPAKAGPPPPIEVLKGGRWLFTYVEPSAAFATSDKPEIIPEGSRRIVRVVDPAQPAAKRLDTAEVYVVDVGELLKAGKATARALPRQAFETAAIAQLPPGDNSLRSARPAAPAGEPPAPGADAGATAATPQATGPVAVTVYGTSWCGACRAARKWLGEHKVPFADKDVETDPAAARELGEKATHLGVPTDRVPILDVRGRLLVGFDPARVQALLGDAI